MVDAKSWRRVLHIISHSKDPVVVVSATDRTTRHLAAMAKTAINDLEAALTMGEEITARHVEIVRFFLSQYGIERNNEIKQNCSVWIQKCSLNLADLLKKIHDEESLSLKNNDAVLSVGEQLSARLFAECGRAFGLSTEWIDARTIIKTDSTFGNAQPDIKKIGDRAGLIEEKVTQNIIPVIGGFYGEDEAGNITTLGFEGSDYSASLIGAALTAEAIEIWTDVSGIYTCDPRTIPNAKPIKNLSFNDAEHLANHGAKVLHPSSVHPAALKNIPVLVKNIFQPQHSGTIICATTEKAGLCKALAYIKKVSVLKINTVSRSIRDHRLVEIFAILDRYEASTIAIETGKEATIVVLNGTRQANQLQEELSEITAVRLIENMGLVGLIGCQSADEQELTNWVNNMIPEKSKMIIYNQQTDVLNLLIDEQELIAFVKQLHKKIFE